MLVELVRTVVWYLGVVSCTKGDGFVHSKSILDFLYIPIYEYERLDTSWKLDRMDSRHNANKLVQYDTPELEKNYGDDIKQQGWVNRKE